MTAAPLLTIPEERQRDELRRALEQVEPFVTRRFVSLTLQCAAWMVLGWFLLGLSFNLTDPDRAQAAFLGGLLVGNGGPAWTLVIAHWQRLGE